jgi:tetratricopeptide (TPR) repeat protein
MTKRTLPADHGWYLYGIAKQSEAENWLASSTPGVHRSALVDAIEYGELAALVSAVPLSEFAPARVSSLGLGDLWLERTTREHERVVDTLQRNLTIVPAPTFSVYSSDDEIRTWLAESHASYTRSLQKLAVAAAGRASLLRAAQTWEAEGKVHTAIDGYSRLLKRHPGSIEGREAFDRLLAIGQGFEENGHFHEALSLFDKIEKLEKLTYLVADSETLTLRRA